MRRVPSGGPPKAPGVKEPCLATCAHVAMPSRTTAAQLGLCPLTTGPPAGLAWRGAAAAGAGECVRPGDTDSAPAVTAQSADPAVAAAAAVEGVRKYDRCGVAKKGRAMLGTGRGVQTEPWKSVPTIVLATALTVDAGNAGGRDTGVGLYEQQGPGAVT